MPKEFTNAKKINQTICFRLADCHKVMSFKMASTTTKKSITPKTME